VKALLVSVLFLTGCVIPSLDIGRRIDGSSDWIEGAAGLEEGKTTLPETLAKLGPPSVIVRVIDVDRLYYVSFESRTIEFTLSAPIPFARQGRSADAFYMSSVSGRVRMARLEFQNGVLLHRDLIDHGSRATGVVGGAVNSTAVSLALMDDYIQDRQRARLEQGAEDP